MRSLRSWQIVCGVALLCRSASAQSTLTARQHFDRGVELAQQGDVEAAAQEFEDAYQISPNYAVLYNLGQADVALGRPVEALKAFESYLANGGPRIGATRRTEVEMLIAASRKRVGYLTVTVAPEGSEVSVDGRLVGRAPIREPFAVVAGEHGVAITRLGYAPYVDHIQITAQKTSALDAHLSPFKTGQLPVGQLGLTSAIPGVTFLLDGQPVAEGGPSPLLVPVGKHRVICQRRDYVSLIRDVEVTTGVVVRIGCDLDREPRLPAASLGILTFVVNQSRFELRVDGRAARSTVALPRGPHTVLIHSDGFRDWVQTINAQPGFPQTIDVQLQETPDHVFAHRQAVRAKRNWAYVIGGAGLAFLGTSAALYVSNGPRFQRYTSARDALARDIQNQHDPASWSQRTADVRTSAISVTRQDDMALGTALAGGALLTYSVVTWLTAN